MANPERKKIYVVSSDMADRWVIQQFELTKNLAELDTDVPVKRLSLVQKAASRIAEVVGYTLTHEHINPWDSVGYDINSINSSNPKHK